jgi:hypothetical protein
VEFANTVFVPEATPEPRTVNRQGKSPAAESAQLVNEPLVTVPATAATSFCSITMFRVELPQVLTTFAPVLAVTVPDTRLAVAPRAAFVKRL